ncbi:MAG TPA: DUF2993 domain-containing protein [Actinomycetota bacterium]|nr:DUF2993 domain-containing protein [Actinomycetota bacterium]
MSVRRQPYNAPSALRRVVFAVVVIAVLLLALDFGARFWAQSWFASRVQDTLDSDASTDIEFHGFPFLTSFAAGHFDRVEVSAGAVDARGLMLRSVHLDLDDVTFPRGSMLSRGSGRIDVGSGRGEVQVPEHALSAYVQARGIPINVELLDGRVRVSTEVQVGPASASASATGPLRLSGRRLVFEPSEVDVDGGVAVPPAAVAFEVPVPRLAPGVEYRSVVVEDRVARLLIEIEDAVLRVREG